MSRFMSYMSFLYAALMARSGVFHVSVMGKRYSVSVVESPHVGTIGGFSLPQAIVLATQFASGATSLTLRVGADDYVFTVTAV